MTATLLTLGCVGLPGPAKAEWHLAMDGGANFSTLHPDSGTDPYSNHAGFYAGASASAVMGRFALRTGLAFTRKGAEIEADPESVDIDYLELPVLLEFTPVDSRLRPVFLAGFAPARRLRVRSSQFSDQDVDDFIEGFDLSAVLGVGVELQRVGLELRYGWGLQDVHTRPTDAGAKNRLLSIGLSFRVK